MAEPIPDQQAERAPVIPIGQTATLPAPLVSAEVDLHGYSSFMLDVDRLLASELVALATPEEGWAAVLLWCRAWKQDPPGSLPDDDRVLASFSGAGKRWAKLKQMALRGFVKCSDGRLYHRVLCDEVNAAWKRRQEHDRKRERDADRLRAWRERNANETQGETRFVAATSLRDRTGQDNTGQDRTELQLQQHRSSEPPVRPPPSDSPRGDPPAARTKIALRGTRLDPNAPMPDEWREWAVAAFGITPQHATRQYHEFRDYWIDVPGAKGLKLRWFPTFKNRLRKLREEGRL